MSETKVVNQNQEQEVHQNIQENPIERNYPNPGGEVIEEERAGEPNAQMVSNSHSNTYIELITERDEENQPISILEVDLVISREKGQENRRLSINFAGIDLETKTLVEKSVNINRDEFEVLKSFFCQLDWNS